MNAEIKKQWVTELRSGKYTQGTGYLNNQGKFCCLGILCDIKDSTAWTASSSVLNCFLYNGLVAMPSQTVYDWCDLDRKEADRLADLNDSGLNFQEIADIIENDAILATFAKEEIK